MKKIFIFMLFIFFTLILPVFASDDDSSDNINEMMKYTNTVENAFVGQKKITDEQYQKALEEKKAKLKKKKKKDTKYTGKNFNEENSGSYIKDTSNKNLILIVPVTLTNGDGKDIPIGHYKIVGEKTDNNVYIDFYQSANLIAKVPAIETQSDFNQQGINFVKLIPYNDTRVKIIYGSMDFNAYTFIKINDKND